MNNENLNDIDAPTEKTPNGYHLYFKKPKSIDHLKSIIKLKYNDRKLNIDILTGGNMVITSPSSYKNNNNEILSYTWIKSIHNHEIKEMPEWLCQICLKNTLNKKAKHNIQITVQPKSNNIPLIIRPKSNNIHIQEMIENIKEIIKRKTNVDIKNFGYYLRNISNQTFFIYQKVCVDTKNQHLLSEWEKYKLNKKGSSYITTL